MSSFGPIVKSYLGKFSTVRVVSTSSSQTELNRFETSLHLLNGDMYSRKKIQLIMLPVVFTPKT